MMSNRPGKFTASILVIDDAPDNLRLLMGILTKEGYEIRASAEAQFGLETARLNHPDLILLDIRMPGMDGYTICEHLKADPRTQDIPVIFISAMGTITDKLKGFDAGGVDYITKPFQAEEVLARVKMHIKLHALQCQVETQNMQLQQEIVKREEAEEELRALNEQLETANQQLQETNRQLQEANAGKDKFFSIIAHDLRQPFTGLLGLLQAILENFEVYEQDRLRHMLEQMQTSTEKTYALVTNLLQWARLEQGVLTSNPVKIALSRVVRANVYLVRQQAAQKQIAIQHAIPEDISIYADYQMIETVIRNLLSNALKFTNTGGHIEITACRRGLQAEITVADTGIGIAREHLPKLFRIDAKYQRAGTANEEGSGLGLILCREFMEKNNGTIRVESSPGHGSRFIVSLPVTAPA